MRKFATMILLFGTWTHATAAEPTVSDAKRMWASFYCSALARMDDDAARQNELIQKGVAWGRPVIEAVNNGSLDASLVIKEVSPFIMTQTGVGADFQLGSLWMAAEQHAVEDIFDKTPAESTEPLPFKSVANAEFKLRNCDLL